MIKPIGMFAVVLAVLFVIPSGQCALTLLNPGFETAGTPSTTAASWSANDTSKVYRKSPSAITSSEPDGIQTHGGAKVLQVYANGIASQSCILDTPNQEITFSAYYLNPAGSQLAGNDYGLLEMVFKNDAGQQLGVPITSGALRPASSDTTWYYREITGTAPANAHEVVFSLKVMLVGGGGASSLLFDDVAVQAVPEPITLALIVMAVLVPGYWAFKRRKLLFELF